MDLKAALALFAALLMCHSAPAAGAPDTAALLDAQRLAMQRLAMMDGQWRGTVRMQQRDGSELTLVQTERVGTLLDGTVRLVEGAGHAADGSRPFQAFGIISFDPRSGTFQMRSHAQELSGDFPLEVRSDGFSWSLSAGPATIRYTATIDKGTWTEVGERLVTGQPPQKFLEMKLQRLGGSDWPAAGAVPPR